VISIIGGSAPPFSFSSFSSSPSTWICESIRKLQRKLLESSDSGGSGPGVGLPRSAAVLSRDEGRVEALGAVRRADSGRSVAECGSGGSFLSVPVAGAESESVSSIKVRGLTVFLALLYRFEGSEVS
jgi:hypothetical protein